MEKKYTTSQVAQILSVHPNTIRWYENTGLISPAARLPNGYRQFDGKHLIQLRICRLIFGSPYTNKSIRGAAFEILHALKEGDIGISLLLAKKYKHQLEKEYASALKTAAMLKEWTDRKPLPADGKSYTRKEVAALLGITTEVVRNWERNGLVCVNRRGRKNEQVYGELDVMRFRVIYMLRQNNYSIAAIHNSLSQYDQGNSMGAALALNQPAADPESIYMSAGDHWLEVLGELSRSAETMIQIITEYNV